MTAQKRLPLPPFLPCQKSLPPPPPRMPCLPPCRLPPSSLRTGGRFLTQKSAVSGTAAAVVAAAVAAAAAAVVVVLSPRTAPQEPPTRGDRPHAMLEGRWRGAGPPAEGGAPCTQSLLCVEGGGQRWVPVKSITKKGATGGKRRSSGCLSSSGRLYVASLNTLLYGTTYTYLNYPGRFSCLFSTCRSWDWGTFSLLVAWCALCKSWPGARKAHVLFFLFGLTCKLYTN